MIVVRVGAGEMPELLEELREVVAVLEERSAAGAVSTLSLSVGIDEDVVKFKVGETGWSVGFGALEAGRG